MITLTITTHARGPLNPPKRPAARIIRATGGRPKDEIDFDQVLPTLTDAQKLWLNDALAAEHGAHPWRERLSP